jgi:sugar transferase (PEP-CTERM/EpsH1 system associated)
MSGLLFLAHRVPYPPNKGDKIRSYHVLRHLAARYEVHLAAFVDDERDMAHADVLRGLCKSVHLVPLNPTLARVRSIVGLLDGRPLGLPYYHDRAMWSHVSSLAAERRIERVFVFSSTMAPYAGPFAGVPRILDMCDVDSDKWLQYAGRHSWPLSWIYRREGELLGAFERRCAFDFDATLLASDSEAECLRRVAPESAHKVHAMRNGVDVEFFDPAREFATPFGGGEEPIVFTGAMDYWANVDAVSWFAREVLPAVRKRRPNARFYIVGSNPADAVRRLASLPGIVVTGSVPDVRPYLRHARVVVAPLRIARGIQNKVLEALAMSRFVVFTPAAMEGLDYRPVPATATAQEADRFADEVAAAVESANGSPAGFAAGRQYVCQHYSWSTSLARLTGLLAA